jgi:beta-mannanase
MSKAGNLTAAIVFALGVCAAGAAQAGQPFLLGAYTGEKTDAFETMVGHTIAIVDHFQNFPDMPKSGVTDDIAAGRVPFISWGSNLSNKTSVQALDILAGKYDKQLNAQAVAIAALGATILIEWEPEMTGNPRNKMFFNGVQLADRGPTYVSVWKYIHDIFVAKGATNVQWVWAPGGAAFRLRMNGEIPCQSYFPGPDYVDWMGLHSFNKSDTPMAYDANQQFLDFYARAPLWAPGKPLLHAQTGATSVTDAQQEWISTAQSSLKSEFPLVRSFIWYNVNAKHFVPGHTQQYALTGAGLTAYQAMLNDPYFQ